MEQYIKKSALVAEIERKQKIHFNDYHINGNNSPADYGACNALTQILSFIENLEVKDTYGQCIQYANIEAGIKAHAEDYSFNIESELFNQLTKEQQKLWRKEIEQAVISGGYNGLGLAKDPRYKENFEVKEVDLEKEIRRYRINNPIIGHREESLHDYMTNVAKHFFELGLKAQKGESV